MEFQPFNSPSPPIHDELLGDDRILGDTGRNRAESEPVAVEQTQDDRVDATPPMNDDTASMPDPAGEMELDLLL